ncbi:right-handed parallel beta-helix repeat-containing protein, partial [Limosilactobacillus reuteri]|uniref:right-handed parallel beta-helix repeat-containing protein n=1 Tax=Limosilactobacillus reuteri TaxID=1598 RepID=UPI00226F65D1
MKKVYILNNDRFYVSAKEVADDYVVASNETIVAPNRNTYPPYKFNGSEGVGVSYLEWARANNIKIGKMIPQVGIEGPQGPKGDAGPQGTRGPVGPQGPKGERGPQGSVGPTGPMGPAGPKGDTGATGATGAKGSTGDRGPQGIQGPKGDKGETGPQGPVGPKGDKGDTGSQGIQGPKGDKGDRGPQGIQGPKGDKGDTGAQGPKGNTGDRGPKGDPGQIPDVSNINKGIADNRADILRINQKMSTMFVNILDFGAQPENVNFDNAPAFNKAIQSLPSVGGTVFIPNGNYFLKSTVNVDRSYVHIMGFNNGLRSGIDPADGSTQTGGGGAKVTVQNPITAFKLENTHNDKRLSGITFSGFDLRGDTNGGVGIDGVSNSDRTVIDNMTINNVGIGVRLYAADAPRITNSWIAETQSSILLTGASQQAEIKNNSLGAQPKGTTIYMENPDRFNISGNNIYPDGAAAIRILNPVHGVITGNTISAYYNGMIEFLPNSEGTFGNGNVISGNVIALEAWHDNPDGKDNKWGVIHIEAFNNV